MMDIPVADRIRRLTATAGNFDCSSIHLRNIELLLAGPCRGIGLRIGVAFEASKFLNRHPIPSELDDLLGLARDCSTNDSCRDRPGNSGLPALRENFPWPNEIPDFVRANEDCHFTRLQTRAMIERCVTERRPGLVIEIGSWLGGSTRMIADYSGAHVIAIDTWLGSEEHQSGTAWDRRHVAHRDVRSLLFHTFAVNCVRHRDVITPLRATSLAGLCEVHRHGLQPGLIFIDGAHDKASVAADLRTAHELFGRDACIVLDDYATGEPWLQGLDEAVNEFATERGCRIEQNAGVCRLLW